MSEHMDIIVMDKPAYTLEEYRCLRKHNREICRVYEADIGKISYFRYDECWSEPEYPHIDKIKKEDFDKEIQEVRSFIEAYLKIEE